jgi:hypothetical protein
MNIFKVKETMTPNQTSMKQIKVRATHTRQVITTHEVVINVPADVHEDKIMSLMNNDAYGTDMADLVLSDENPVDTDTHSDLIDIVSVDGVDVQYED